MWTPTPYIFADWVCTIGKWIPPYSPLIPWAAWSCNILSTGIFNWNTQICNESSPTCLTARYEKEEHAERTMLRPRHHQRNCTQLPETWHCFKAVQTKHFTIHLKSKWERCTPKPSTISRSQTLIWSYGDGVGFFRISVVGSLLIFFSFKSCIAKVSSRLKNKQWQIKLYHIKSSLLFK